MTKPVVDNITIEHVIAVYRAFHDHPDASMGAARGSDDRRRQTQALTLAYFMHRQTGVLNEIAKVARDVATAGRYA